MKLQTYGVYGGGGGGGFCTRGASTNHVNQSTKKNTNPFSCGFTDLYITVAP